MKRDKILIPAAALAALLLLAVSLHSVEIKNSAPVLSTSYGNGLMVSVRVTGGNGSVLEPGESVKLTFQTNEDAYVVLYNIDSEGFVNLLYPRDGEPTRVEGGKVYFLPEAGSGLQWVTEGGTGIEYIHAVAVADRNALREQELYFLARNRNQPEEERFRVDGDPFLSFNTIDEEIVENARENPPATDYTYFYINRVVDYPRYLCSKCHAPGKLTDPYNMECPEIVVERFAYDEKPAYPYPPLFDITHVDGGVNEEYYASGKYIERRFEDDYEEYGDYYDDTPIYLSIYYSNYSYPYRYYWPSYRTFWTSYRYDPFLWDFYWYWDFGFNYYFTDYYYHYWPFYTWYYPYNYYWAWDYYHYDYWRYDDCCYRDYRPLYSDRTLVKRTINYASTNNELLRDKTISKSPLSQRQTGAYARRADDARAVERNRGGSGAEAISRSRLADRTARKTVTRSGDYRSRIVTPARQIPEKRVVHGSERSRDGDARRAVERKTPVRRTPSGAIIRRNTERSGSSDGRSTESSGSSGTRTIDRSRPAKKNDAADRSKSSGGTSGSKAVKKSDTRKETPSNNSSRTSRSTSSRSASSRSADRSSGSSPARSSSSGGSRSSGSSSGSGKTRRK